MPDIRRRSKYIPELAFFDSHESAKNGSIRAMRRLRKQIVYIVYLAFLLLPVIGAPQLPGVSNLWNALSASPWLRRTLIALYSFIVTIVGWKMTLRDRYRRLLREELIQLGVPICVHCGYDLRGLTESRCPECGRAFDSTFLTGPIVPTYPGETK